VTAQEGRKYKCFIHEGDTPFAVFKREEINWSLSGGVTGAALAALILALFLSVKFWEHPPSEVDTLVPPPPALKAQRVSFGKTYSSV
jgi:hypothetical protein